MTKIDVFVINIPTHTERLTNFKNHYPYKCYVIQAIEGREHWNTDVMLKWPNMNHSIIASNYKGLQLSMRKSIITAKEMDSDWAVVCEDDGEFPKTINFENIIKRFNDSHVIWLDARNKEGDGYIPYSRMNAVMYHKSVFELMINELHPDTSKEMSQWSRYHNRQAMVNDYYIPWMLSRSGFKVSSINVVKSNVQTKKFQSTVRCDGDWKTKYDGTLDDNATFSFDGMYNIFSLKKHK